MVKPFNTHPVLQAFSEGLNFVVMAGLTLASAAVLWPKRFDATAAAYFEPLRVQYYLHHPRGRVNAELVGVAVPEFYAKVTPPELPRAKVAGKLNLTYAGSASFTKAIVLMFDGTFENATAANEHIKVTNKAGKPVEGQWLVAKGNPQMLLYSVPPGVYSVAVGEGLTDKGNRAIAAAASGAVFVP